MIFLVLGLITLALGIYFLIKAKHHHDHDSEEGAMTLIIASVILIVLYGLFYQALVRLTI